MEPGTGITIEEKRGKECHYAIGEGAEGQFCAQPTIYLMCMDLTSKKRTIFNSHSIHSISITHCHSRFVTMKLTSGLVFSGLLASVSAVPIATGPSGKWFDRMSSPYPQSN
jgi:hypothetical protein